MGRGEGAVAVRADLCAVTEEDLAAFSNRGSVNRAAKEAAGGALTCELVEADDGAVHATWSDGFTIDIPADKTLRESRCSCLAIGTCRHVVRTVLYYQRTQKAPRAVEPWDPGQIPDAELEKHLPRAALEKARALLEAGLLAELVRSSKPLARLHGLACNVRFRVPGDVRYAAADCAPAAAPAMAALAVWSFRRLPAGVTAGFVVTGQPSAPPAAALDELDAAARAWFTHGLAGAPPHLDADLRRLESACRAAELTWPAENVAAFGEELARYAAHDALFSPERMIETVGELLARVDALRSATGAVPLPLVRGNADDRPIELGAARLVGLGCGVRVRRGGVRLVAHLQDLDSGTVSIVARDFRADPDDAEPRPFHRLGDVPITQGAGLAQIGRSQLLLSKAKRSASGTITIGRSRCTLSPQGYAWEQLREPTLVDDLDELRARLAALPPSCLRPLHAAESFHVLAVTGAEQPGFDEARQQITATLRDADGRAATLVHPYHARAHQGCELLLARLTQDRTVMVAGQVALTHAGITIEPAMVVLEKGGKRTAVQPWVDRAPEIASTASAAGGGGEREPVGAYLGELHASLAGLLQTGLRRADEASARRLRDSARAGESLGLGRLPGRVGHLAGALDAKLHDARWDPAAAAVAACELAVLLRLAQDLS
jgi:hypothetical protein